MTQVSIQDIQYLIAFLIQNNKSGLIQSMNNNGYAIPSSISDDKLFQQVWDVFSAKGLDGLKNIFSTVYIDKSKATVSQQQAITDKFQIIDPNSKSFGDWFNGAIQTGSDILGGHSTTVSGGGSSVSTPGISSTTIIWFAAAAIIAIVILAIIFRKRG